MLCYIFTGLSLSFKPCFIYSTCINQHCVVSNVTNFCYILNSQKHHFATIEYYKGTRAGWSFNLVNILIWYTRFAQVCGWGNTWIWTIW